MITQMWADVYQTNNVSALFYPVWTVPPRWAMASLPYVYFLAQCWHVTSEARQESHIKPSFCFMGTFLKSICLYAFIDSIQHLLPGPPWAGHLHAALLDKRLTAAQGRV